MNRDDIRKLLIDAINHVAWYDLDETSVNDSYTFDDDIFLDSLEKVDVLYYIEGRLDRNFDGLFIEAETFGEAVDYIYNELKD